MAIMTIPRPLQITLDDHGRFCSDDDNNTETAEKTEEYFLKCSESFGTVISKDMKFCATQSLYKRFAKISEKDGVTTVDISKVPRPPQMNDVFYISSKEPLETWIGCDVYDYEKKNGFWTYAIKPISNVMKFDNV